ncbi:MAG: GNAT family N-acetyltransferase [Terriglobia bacterium]|jgi:RimJ/RimL family protein N-acetyltransferase
MDSLTDRKQNVILETDRLRFATWVKEDWLEFRKLTADPLVVRYITTGEPWPDERVQEFVARQCENWEKHHICLWKLLPKDSDALIGICGLQHLAGTPDVEIGWWLAPSHWGKGLATEAARQALAYGFEVSNIERIVAIAQSANRDSLRVMDRIGMRFEREAIHKGIRVVLYAIERDRFLSRRGEGEERA